MGDTAETAVLMRRVPRFIYQQKRTGKLWDWEFFPRLDRISIIPPEESVISVMFTITSLFGETKIPDHRFSHGPWKMHSCTIVASFSVRTATNVTSLSAPTLSKQLLTPSYIRCTPSTSMLPVVKALGRISAVTAPTSIQVAETSRRKG